MPDNKPDRRTLKLPKSPKASPGDRGERKPKGDGKPKTEPNGKAAGKPTPKPERSPPDQPGTLRGGASLVLQTRQAQQVLWGRLPQPNGKPPIPGLFRFAKSVGHVWQAAGLDDPYADWMLIRLADELQTTHTRVREQLGRITARLESTPGVELSVAHSLYPVTLPLRFKAPYAFMAAYLIGDFDTLARTALTARHGGLLTRPQTEQLLHESARRIRRVLQMPDRWQDFRLTRNDVRQNTPAAQEAVTVLGPLPTEVLEGRWRAPHAPDIVRSSDREQL